MSAPSPHVFLLGAVPPPLGGISVHTERLARLLLQAGYRVTVFDFQGRGPSEPLPDGGTIHRGSPLRASWALLRAALRERPSIIHAHISVGGNLLKLLPLLLFLARRTRLTCTIHSGSFPAEAERFRSTRRRAYRAFFHACSALIAVNEDIATALETAFSVPRERMRVIPAFLPASLEPPGVTEPSSASGRRLLASGYGTPTYNWEELLDAIDGLDDVDEAVLTFYHDYQEPYYGAILERAQQIERPRVTVRNDLPPREFQSELLRSTVFIRPTRTDGDSVALREALSMGKIAIASDAVPRPRGTHVHPLGDAQALRALLRRSDLSAPSADDIEDFGDDLLALYAELAAPSTPAAS